MKTILHIMGTLLLTVYTFSSSVWAQETTVVWQKPLSRDAALVFSRRVMTGEEKSRFLSAQPQPQGRKFTPPDFLATYSLSRVESGKQPKLLWRRERYIYNRRGGLESDFVVLDASHQDNQVILVNKSARLLIFAEISSVLNVTLPQVTVEALTRDIRSDNEVYVSASIRGKLSNNTLAVVVKDSKEKEHRFFYDNRTKKWSRVPPKRKAKKTATPSPRATPTR